MYVSYHKMPSSRKILNPSSETISLSRNLSNIGVTTPDVPAQVSEDNMAHYFDEGEIQKS